MKNIKLLLISLCLLTSNQPIFAINWDNFSWNNIKKQTIAAVSAVGLGFVGYLSFNKLKNHPFFTNTQAIPSIKPQTLEKKLAAKVAKSKYNANVSYQGLTNQNIATHTPVLTPELDMSFQAYCNQIENSNYAGDDLTLSALAEVFNVNIEEKDIRRGDHFTKNFECQSGNTRKITIYFDPYSRLPYHLKNSYDYEDGYPSGYTTQFGFMLGAGATNNSSILQWEVRALVSDHIRNSPTLKAAFFDALPSNQE